MDSTQHLTSWTDADFEHLVQRVEAGIREGRLAVLGGTRGPSELAAIGEGEGWLDDFADQIATVLDLGVYAYEGASDADLDEWADLDPASDRAQVERWVEYLRNSAQSLGNEWTAHVATYDRVIADAAAQVTIDPERGRVIGQLMLHTVVVNGASTDPISDGAEAVTLTLALTRNELLYLANRAQRAADMLSVVLQDTGGDE